MKIEEFNRLKDEFCMCDEPETIDWPEPQNADKFPWRRLRKLCVICNKEYLMSRRSELRAADRAIHRLRSGMIRPLTGRGRIG